MNCTSSFHFVCLAFSMYVDIDYLLKCSVTTNIIQMI